MELASILIPGIYTRKTIILLSATQECQLHHSWPINIEEDSSLVSPSSHMKEMEITAVFEHQLYNSPHEEKPQRKNVFPI